MLSMPKSKSAAMAEEMPAMKGSVKPEMEFEVEEMDEEAPKLLAEASLEELQAELEKRQSESAGKAASQEAPEAMAEKMPGMKKSGAAC